MIVYYGTTIEIQKPDIKHSKAHLDFGIGFYTTTFPKQAERWAYRKGMRLSKPAIVNVYETGVLKKEELYAVQRLPADITLIGKIEKMMV